LTTMRNDLVCKGELLFSAPSGDKRGLDSSFRAAFANAKR
jgi:hypothetical protein